MKNRNKEQENEETSTTGGCSAEGTRHEEMNRSILMAFKRGLFGDRRWYIRWWSGKRVRGEGGTGRCLRGRLQDGGDPPTNGRVG